MIVTLLKRPSFDTVNSQHTTVDLLSQKKLLNLRNIKRIHSEIKLNSQYAKRKKSGFEKHQVYSYLIREKDSEFIVTRETPSQFIVDSPNR